MSTRALSLAILLASSLAAGAPKVRSNMVVSTAWLAQHLKDPNIVIVQVAHDRKEYDAGHIAGARYLSWADLVRTRDGVSNELPPAAQLKETFERLGIGEGKRVILYGDNSGLSATRAWFTLDYLGKGDMAAVLDGGIEKWKAGKRALSTEVPPEAARAELVIRPRPEAVAHIDAVRDLSWTAANTRTPQTVLIDSRAASNFTAGHIPGAVNLAWPQHLVSKDDPSFKPPKGLRKLYEAAGLRAGQKAVAYCGSGVQATHTYFVLRYLGYDAALYDGSMSEWSAAKDAPVAR